VAAVSPGHLGRPRHRSPEGPVQELHGGQGDRLGGLRGKLGRRGRPHGPRRGAGCRLDGMRQLPGRVRETHFPAGEHRVQVVHALGMAADQPPGTVQFRLAELPESRKRFGQLESAGPGQRADVAESEGRPGRRGRRKWVPAGNEQFPPMSGGRPVSQQFGEGGITNGPAAGFGCQVAVEIVEDQQDRHMGQDLAAEQGQPVGPGQVGPPRCAYRFRLAAAGGQGRMAAEGGGHAGQHPVGGYLAADDPGDAPGLEVAHPRGDLAGQRGLADPAGPVQHQPGQRRAGQIRGPAPPLGRPDRQRRGRAGLRAAGLRPAGPPPSGLRAAGPRFSRAAGRLAAS
jgi:hypothetical protein